MFRRLNRLNCVFDGQSPTHSVIMDAQSKPHQQATSEISQEVTEVSNPFNYELNNENQYLTRLTASMQSY